MVRIVSSIRVLPLLATAFAILLFGCAANSSGLSSRQPVSLASVSQQVRLARFPAQQAQPTDIPEDQPTPTPESLVPPTATAAPTSATLGATPPPTPSDLTSIYNPNPGAESGHPYENNTDQQWILSGTDPMAGAVRLHFSQIELEEGVDWLIVYDGMDAEIQRLTGSYPSGLWTELVPGSLVKLRLITDTSVQKWGFLVDAIADAQFKTLAYSPHPYPHYADPLYESLDLKWQFDNLDPAAQGTRLHFSRIDLEPNVDWIVVMDLTETPYQWITGHHPDGLWTRGIPGNGVIIKLYTDSSVNAWGFNLDALESAPPETAEPKPGTNQSLAESKHNYEERAASWTLINPNAQATFTKVHFTRLDIGDGELALSDGNGNRVQTYGGDTHLKDYWSRDVPGRVVKIRLTGGRYNQDWGFRIDQLANGEPITSLAESKHSYEEQTVNWTLINRNAQATFTKVHFTRIDIGDGELVLSDGNDNRIQTFWGDTHLVDFWSDDIPGRIVKIRLTGGRYNQGWGFRIDQLANGEPIVSLAESKHYYEGAAANWTLVNRDAQATFTRVHFTRIDIGDGELVLFDEKGAKIQTFGGNTHLRDVWSSDIPGRIVKIRLTGGRYNQDWGFRVDQIASSAGK